MKNITLFALFIANALLAQPTSDSPKLDDWPAASRSAAQEIITLYGAPDVVHSDLLIWKDRGIWKVIHIDKQEDRHSYPVEHTDMMKQCVSYNVPVERIHDLTLFNGSLTFERTQGLLCARCDKEAHNLLILNLANDIINGIKTVDQATAAFAVIIRQNMNGASPDYMNRLVFAPHENAGNPGENILGMTKTDTENYRKKFAGR